MPRSKLRPAPPRTAADARATAKVNVASPYSHGIDRVDRVIDTVDALYRRKQIDRRQKEAADVYRDAFDAVGGGSIGGAMDFDKVRSGGSAGGSPTPAALIAAETLRHASAALGELDSMIMQLVVGVGHSVEHVAGIVLGKATLSARDQEHVGRRLREALTLLANKWFPLSKGSAIRGEIAAGARPTAGAAGTRDVGARTAHASGHAVRFSDETKARAPAA